MTVRDTSMEAYKDILDSLGPRQVEVLTIIKDNKCIDCKHIAKLLCVDRCQITGRIDELKKEGLIYEAGKFVAQDETRRTIHYAPVYF